MLVLSRKPGESIRIGNDILVTITEIRGGRVKIGISAPDACTIRRAELEDWNETSQPAKAATPIASEQSKSARRQKAVAASLERQQQQVSHNRIRLAVESSANPLTVR